MTEVAARSICSTFLNGELGKFHFSILTVSTFDDQMLGPRRFDANHLDRHLALLFELRQVVPLAVVEEIGDLARPRVTITWRYGSRWLARISRRITSIAMLSGVFTTPEPPQLGHSM